MAGDLRIWLLAHVPRGAVLVFLLGVLLELLVGSSPLALPGLSGSQYLWGLVLPLLSIAAVCICLDSGFWWLEAAVRRQWFARRLLWVTVLTVVALLPGLWAQDGLAVDGSIRNRLLLLAVALLALRVIPVELAVLPAAVLLLVATLMGGSGAGASPLASAFLAESAGPLQLLVAVALWGMGALAYAALHPSVRHRAPTGETVS